LHPNWVAGGEEEMMIIEGSVYDARHPLVVAEAGEVGRAAVLAGIECAARNDGRLSVVYLLEPDHSAWLGAAGPFCCAALPSQELDEVATGEQVLAAARADVPFDMPVCTQLLARPRGHCKRVLVAAETLGCDAIIVPMSRQLPSLRRGLDAALARHSQLPIGLIRRAQQSPGKTASAAGMAVIEAVG
jgi:hypothetical protein